MGEVYQATDTKLKRSVALKILPPLVASDHDRLVRFQREAEVLASLNHPHIAAIYGLEEAGSISALIMELVEGEDLSQLIARGAVPPHDALPIARQIAEALEAAHDRGIIHRDLKPANIKVRSDGTVKVLDFGLAKAMDPAIASSVNAMNSPTLSMHATQAGMILGTAAYMAPEQAKGKPVDRRADIWAFGIVLCEMITGRQMYTGETAPETLARIIERDADLSRLPPQTPPPIRALLERCLTKDPRNRLQAIGEARIAIDHATNPSFAVENPDVHLPNVIRGWQRTLPWTVAAATLAAAAALLTLMAPWRRSPQLAVIRVSAELGADVSLVTTPGDVVILSPDGMVVGFVARKAGGGSPLLYVRRLSQLQATPLVGTDDADSPFFSPDGQWIAFFAAGKLKKISVTGGAVVTLSDAPDGRGGAWGEDGTIVFSPDSQPGVRLLRVSSAGGTPEPVTSLAEGEATHRWPQIPPGAGRALYEQHHACGITTPTSWCSSADGPEKGHSARGYHGRHLPSGHLVHPRWDPWRRSISTG